MKKVVSLLLVFASLFVLAGVLTSCADRTTYINVYNWGEYISDGADDSLDVNAAFTEATGIKVNYSNFASNEDMYAKLQGGGSSYDVIFPSDYMVERMIKEDMLLPLDYANIPNADNVLPEYRGLYYDKEDKYCLPYNVGMVGLIYNKKLVDEAPDSWAALWDKKYEGQILMFNNPRDAFAIAQSLLGIDYNTTNTADWDRVLEKMKEQKDVLQSYVMDEVFMKMENGEAALAPYYVGDFLTMRDNNPDLELVFPKEGSNIFVDVVCIPKCAGNKAGAEAYINFLLNPEIALANAEYLYYTTPFKSVIEDEEYSLKDDPYTFPSEEVKANAQYFHNLDEDTLKYMNDLWDQLKVESESSAAVYIALAVLVLGVGAFLALKISKKKKMEKMYH
ncbi:MAG: spermidine/putrescine ABC transporter substrate-binding protein [Lachnospiraceae bacterium]|nr:spermidine/putrescine ABC transporter substrate-binding protein [Lachnospiraceae bacterium]